MQVEEGSDFLDEKDHKNMQIENNAAVEDLLLLNVNVAKEDKGEFEKDMKSE